MRKTSKLRITGPLSTGVLDICLYDFSSFHFWYIGYYEKNKQLLPLFWGMEHGLQLAGKDDTDS